MMSDDADTPEITDASGMLSGIRALIAQDDTRMLQVFKLAELGTMSSMILHDIRQPLATIKGFVQILLHEAHQRGSNEGILARVLTQVEEMEAMTGVFLDFARSPVPAMLPLSLHDPVERALQVVSPRLRSRRISVTQSLPPRIAPVLANLNAIQQVLVNLLLNAIDACESLPPDRPRQVWIVLEPSRGGVHLKLTVADSGPGIDPLIRPSLFDYFSTTKPEGKGTGLGLAIARELIRLHAGSLDVVDPEELGISGPAQPVTAFRIVLPVHPSSSS